MKNPVLDLVKITKKNIISSLLIIGIFFIDRISKTIIINLENSYGAKSYTVNKFLNFDLIWNEGIAFGMLSFTEKSYYNIITFIIVIVTFVVFLMMLRSYGFQKYGFLMVFGGSIGNIFDRIYYSSVPDFIDIHFKNFHWFIFNVADIFISTGVILLIYSEFYSKKKHD